MHILLRERHGLEEAAAAEDLGQAPADLVVLSFADSDLGAFAAAWRSGRDTLPSLRLANLRRLTHPLSVDLYIEKTLSEASGILIRLLGGIEYWRYGVEQVSALAAAKGMALAIVPGDGRPDPRLDAVSNLPPSTLRRLKTLCDGGGTDSARAALAQLGLAAGLPAVPPVARAALHRHGFYVPGTGVIEPADLDLAPDGAPIVLVVFYRAILAASDTDPVDRLIGELARRGTRPIGLFAASLKDPECDGWLRQWIARIAPDVIINATAFSARGDGGIGSPLDVVDAPVLQVALAGSSREVWTESDRGLSPPDLAIHVVLPEFDGRIFAGVASFKKVEATDPELGYARTVHAGDDDRIAAIVARAAALIALRRTGHADKRLAIVLSAYPGRDDQMAHAVGLDAPESTVELLNVLRDQGYAIANTPACGAALIDRLKTETIRWPVENYRAALARLNTELVADIELQWGAPESDSAIDDGYFVFKAVYCGQVLVALQPDRGQRADRAAEYHDPRRSPRHSYVAFYLWLRHVEQSHALIHMGAHGTLEWLPGKSVALSSSCWPDALLGPTPVIYPFIVNNPGEAAVAKRRLGAVTIGHITPPISSGKLPLGLHAIERLLDEYSVAEGLDPRRRERLAQAIIDTARDSGLDRDSGLTDIMTPREAVVRLDSFVCDVKNTLVADGLHVLGRVPTHFDADQHDIPYEACAAGERAALLAALDGKHVEPGPAGSPWRGRRDVLPTGRNLFTVDSRAVPSRTAIEQGKRLVDALLTRHLQDHGDYPRNIMLNLWGSATMRTAGEEFAMALQLMGVAPVWDATSDRVTGFDVITLAVLGRPRIDVTLRISGLFRDVFPTLPVLFEQAAAALAARDEPDEENPYRAASGPRVFGPAPGDYGVGVVETVTEFTPATLEEAGESWLADSAFAYGGGHDGIAARPALEQRTAAADAFVHTQDLPETDLLAAPDFAAHEGGFAAAARKLSGAAPTLYHADSATPDAPRMRTLAEEIARVVRGRAANPRWLAGQMRHGFRGAAEIAATLDQMALFAHLAGAVESHHFDLYYDATLGNDEVRRFIEQANPEAAAVMRLRFQQVLDAGYWTTRRNSAIDGIAKAPVDAEAAS
ncbi:cobaltochelatase subunit CobN [Bradyrhizobium canariense]|uniref:Cobaltochelatase CobN subunit n=1 Tax=Bradyrhizobium canariense TaxID=255045 RepID=A0A1H1X8N2_9BRAD|nr:cobaltochelatase subunit CobN [Bradyrhizobium canariense]SDT05421.1 cobaltochelatase CobN subunit [Bradyrhizobium canariense]